MKKPKAVKKEKVDRRNELELLEFAKALPAGQWERAWRSQARNEKKAENGSNDKG